MIENRIGMLVGLGTIISVVFGQIVASAVWAGTQSTRIENIQERQVMVDKQLSLLATQSERLVRLEERMDAIAKHLLSIDTFLHRRYTKEGGDNK